MLIKSLALLLGISCSSSLWSMTCYYTLAKDSCWTNYNVSVDIFDANTNKLLVNATVPAGTHWVREPFECQPSQKLMYKAQFSPVFWQSDIGKIYASKDYWTLPATINQGDSAWNLSVCYPAAFAQVPMPPEATAQCACDFSSIPAIPPKQL
ncbi:MAG: hypothetical protein ACRC0B_06745 [Legionella sp.]